MPEEAPPEQPRVLRMVPKQDPAAQAEPDLTTTGAEAVLLDLLEAIQSGRFKPHMLVIHCMTEGPSESLRHHYWTWNVRPLDHLGLLTLAQTDVLQGYNTPL